MSGRPRSIQGEQTGPDLSWLHDYPEEFLVCREQHRLPLGDPKQDHWVEDFGESGRHIGWHRTLMCERCHLIITHEMSLDGSMRRAPGRRYPKGYSAPKGNPASRRDVRLERVRRLTQK